MTGRTRQYLQEWLVSPADPGAVPNAVAAAGDIAGSAPGTVHTDLWAAGLIEDPSLDDNEALQRWIGQSDWVYRCRFDADPCAENIALVFAGVDTVADIELNGTVLGRVENMHRTHRFDVGHLVRARSNELAVLFRSPVRAADAASIALGARPHANHHPYNAIRKMACGFGWDWGIDTATSGLWRPVWIESRSGPVLDDVVVNADVDAEGPFARVCVGVVGARGRLEARVRVAGAEATAVVRAEAATEIIVRPEGAALWWPRDYGVPALHDLSVSLREGDDDLDERSFRIGFRHVEVRTPEGADGAGFELRVNGRVILVRGANWIPDDVFPHRVTRDRYARRLDQAQFAGINLLRVWGGGIYESDDFFEECSARGILVWQDFLLACAAYAEEEPLRSEFAREATEAVVRLGAHPSLVIFNGGNENLWGRQEWRWEGRLDGQTWGAHYYYDLFPSLVAALAPHVAYTPGSPFSPDRHDRQNDPTKATTHVWDVWNSKDYSHYRDVRPRFVAEFGWQGPPTWSTLTEAISDDPLTPESPGMIVHQKAVNGNDKLTDGLAPHFPLPRDMEDWHWAMSLNQAHAVQQGIEWFRGLAPLCTGSIVWQLNDCWPVTSWSAVDGKGRPKPLLYALRHAHAPRTIAVQPDDEGFIVAVVNDTDDAWHAEVTLERRRYDGSIVVGSTVTVHAGARTAERVRVPDVVVDTTSPEDEFIVAGSDGVRGMWFFSEPRASRLGPAHVDVSAHADDEGWTIDVVAHDLVRDLTLLVDRIDPEAVADDALLTLLPGESARVRVVGAVGADPTSFSGPTVLRTANDLLHGRTSR